MDYYYYIAIALLILSFIITLRVRISYKLNDEENASVSGFEAANKIISDQGLTRVHVMEIGGTLTDNYNPSNHTVNLSTGVYHHNSVSAIAIAAHECGHAMQYASGYPLVMLRMKLVPVGNISSYASYILIMLGLFFDMMGLVTIGAILFSVIVLFNIITLPIEIDASKRGLAMIQKLDLLTPEQFKAGKSVLTAAGLTYFMNLLSSIVTLLRYISIILGRRKRR